jgi:hypothetical protein
MTTWTSYDIHDADTGELIEADVLPTPWLISEGAKPHAKVEAYIGGQTGRGQNIWYARRGGGVPPADATFRHVKVRVTEK